MGDTPADISIKPNNWYRIKVTINILHQKTKNKPE